MRKHIHLLLVIGLCSSALTAQTTFLSLSNPSFHQIIPLQIDSLYHLYNLTNSSIIYEIGFDYDSDHRLLRSRQKTTSLPQNTHWYEYTELTHSPGRTVSNIILQLPDIFRSRITSDSIAGNLSTRVKEFWNETAWQEVEIDSFHYNTVGNIVRSINYFREFDETVWKAGIFSKYEYDALERLSVSKSIDYANDGVTSLLNYSYDAAGHLISTISRYGYPWAMQNVIQELRIHDSNGNIDTIKSYLWSIESHAWTINHMIVLDDSPEQQTDLQGKRYHLNGQSELYLLNETTYTPGPQVYTDQPAQVFTRGYNALLDLWEDNLKLTTSYSELPDGTIKGSFQHARYLNGSWDTTRIVQAWHRKLGTVNTQSPEEKNLPACGLPNPLATDNLSANLPSGAKQSLELYSTDGRLIFNGRETIGPAPKQSTWYVAAIRDGGKIICTQKILLH